MRQWLVALKHRTIRILQILWGSPLSSAIVLNELRENNIIFHLLQREVAIEPGLPWDGQIMAGPEFLVSDASMTFIEFLALRAETLEYVGTELCSATQNRMPNLKRRILDALNGRIAGDSDEPIIVSTIFDLYDFLPADGQWKLPPPQFTYFRDLDLKACVEGGSISNPIYNIDRVREIILLKRTEGGMSQQVVPRGQEGEVDREEAILLEYLIFSNRQEEITVSRLKVLRSWTNVLLIMCESDELKGGARISFLLQVLQAILPTLDSYGPDNPDEAYELAKLAR